MLDVNGDVAEASETNNTLFLLDYTDLQTRRVLDNLSIVTDNAGVAAIDAPELMGRETWFTVIADGYEAAADGFGFRGVRWTPTRDLKSADAGTLQ